MWLYFSNTREYNQWSKPLTFRGYNLSLFIIGSNFIWRMNFIDLYIFFLYCVGISFLYLDLYPMLEPWWEPLLVVKWQNTSDAKGYFNNFIILVYCLLNYFQIISCKIESLVLVLWFFFLLLSWWHFSYVNKMKMQSLIIAAIPNIIGWLAISFAQVSFNKLLILIVDYCFYCYIICNFRKLICRTRRFCLWEGF